MRKARPVIALVIVSMALIGCGSDGPHHGGAGGAAGSSGEGVGGADAGGHGGNISDAGSSDGKDASGGGDAADASDGCATAVAQGVCTTEGAVCSSGCTDVCQFCNLLRCTSGHWQTQETLPAPCFACGTTLRCQINAQYCYSVVGGAIGNPPSYQCRSVPGACLPHPTCACLRDQSLAASTCADSVGDAGTGQITVTLQAP